MRYNHRIHLRIRSPHFISLTPAKLTLDLQAQGKVRTHLTNTMRQWDTYRRPVRPYGREKKGLGVENACQHTHTFTHPPRPLDQYLRAASLDPGPPAYFTFPYPSRTHPLSSLLASPAACFSVLLSSVPPAADIRRGYLKFYPPSRPSWSWNYLERKLYVGIRYEFN